MNFVQFFEMLAIRLGKSAVVCILLFALSLVQNSPAQLAVNPFARSGRFNRGTGSDAENNSFVIPIDFQKGVPPENPGENTNKFRGGRPWFTRIHRETRFHYDEGASEGGLDLDFPFENP